ncbi:MAG TPA: MFS transporter, partial [Shewanella frigidimarina]|nr:MFS transporter [Shewanella frigidimarina]
YASKERIAREALSEHGMNLTDIANIPQGEAFSRLVSVTGQDPQALTQALYQANNIGMAWYIIAAIGIISAVGIFIYGKWLLRMQRQQVA